MCQASRACAAVRSDSAAAGVPHDALEAEAPPGLHLAPHDARLDHVARHPPPVFRSLFAHRHERQLADSTGNCAIGASS